MSRMYKGWTSMREVSGWWGRVGSWRWVIPAITTQAAVLCLQQVTETDSIHRIWQNSHWQQFGTTHIPNNADHRLHSPCTTPSWFDMVGKKLSVKINMAIYSHVLGVPG